MAGPHFVQLLVELQGAPELAGPPDLAEASSPLQAESLEVDGDGLVWGGFIKPAGLAFDAEEGLGQALGAKASLLIEFAQLEDGLLADLGAGADGADQSPVGV